MYGAGDSGDDTENSVCGEKGDIMLPAADFKGASRAMASYIGASYDGRVVGRP